MTIRMTLLGTNGWYDTATGNTICILLETARTDIILDAGNGLGKLDRYRAGRENKPAILFLSHFHLDHVSGLHTLVKQNIGGGLTIGIPAGSRSALDTLLDPPFTVPLRDLPYPARVLELPDDIAQIPCFADVLPLRHAGLTLGCRIEADGCVIAYCPDTGYCAHAVALAKNADMLIAECAYPSGKANEEWPHLNPETAARIAVEAGAKRLCLVHFDAHQYPTLEDRHRAEAASKAVFPNTTAGFDEMVLEIP